MRSFTFVFVAVAFLVGCDERELYQGLPPVEFDGGSRSNGDADANDWVDSDVDEDQPEVEPPECGYPATGYGYRPGRVLEPFELESCDGELTNLPRLWCGNTVTIVHLAVAWCGSCMSSTHRLLQDVMIELEGEPVGHIEILLENQPGEVAEAEACQWWSEYYTPNVTTYIPPGGVLDGPLLWLASEDALPLTVVVDAAGEIISWSSLELPADLLDQVRSRLE